MAEYIEREALLKDIEESVVFTVRQGQPSLEMRGANKITDRIKSAPTADVVEVKHGEWDLEVHSFYADNWDESIELRVYILASCSNCGEEHKHKQVFSKHLYAPEDADDDFRFDQEYEKSKALEEFKQTGYEFKKYCSNCGAKMDKRSEEK